MNAAVLDSSHHTPVEPAPKNAPFAAATALVDSAAMAPLPRSRKVYVQGSRPDLRVPMRMVEQSDTPVFGGAARARREAGVDRAEPGRLRLRHLRSVHRSRREDRHPLGPARAARRVDRRTRRHRRADRADAPRYGRERLADPEARGAALRPAPPADARAKAGSQRLADALRAAGHRHARDGVHRHPREPSARRTRRACVACGPTGTKMAELLTRQHPGQSFGASIPAEDHAGVRARRSRPRPRDHPGQHQSPRDRADDHRPQLPGEDQRQHRQLGRHVVASTKKSRR